MGYLLDRGVLAKIDLPYRLAEKLEQFHRVNVDFVNRGSGKDVDQLLRTPNFEFALSCAGIAPSTGQKWPASRREAEAGSSPVPLHCACPGLEEEGLGQSGVA